MGTDGVILPRAWGIIHSRTKFGHKTGIENGEPIGSPFFLPNYELAKVVNGI